MAHPEPFIDIHCHLLPGLDDGAKSWAESLAMSRMAASDGVGTIIATPHQLGSFAHIDGQLVRERTGELQKMLDQQGVPLRVAPGADVRIDADIMEKLQRGNVLTLADQGKHLLLELPHELYFPLDNLLAQLETIGIVGILSHPERNQGLLRDPRLIEPLVDRGCLMQITANSLAGTFGQACQQMADWLLQQDLVHFVASDAHGPKSRRPLLGQAFHQVARLVGWDKACDLCCRNPAAVAAGQDVPKTPRKVKSRGLSRWLPWRKAG